jgi:hypothetical protein
MMSNNFTSKWMDFSENTATPQTDKTIKSSFEGFDGSNPRHISQKKNTSVGSVGSNPRHIFQNKFEEYLNKLVEKHKYDPRPDLKKDSKLWQVVLKTAERVNKQIYSNLHSFRIAGARLKVKDGKLKLIPTIGQNKYWKTKADYQKDRKEYLLPYTEEIKEIFKEVEDGYSN